MCYTRLDFIVKIYDYVKWISKVSMGCKAIQEASKKCVNQFSNNNKKVWSKFRHSQVAGTDCQCQDTAFPYDKPYPLLGDDGR